MIRTHSHWLGLPERLAIDTKAGAFSIPGITVTGITVTRHYGDSLLNPQLAASGRAVAWLRRVAARFIARCAMRQEKAFARTLSS